MSGYGGDEAAPERVRWPRLTAIPDPRLRPLRSRGYVGFTEATSPRHLVLPATAAVPLVVKLADSPYRPPAFVMGGHDTSIVLEGDCAPSYLEVLLSPLGAYRILGLPLDQLNGHTVDLADVLGPGCCASTASGGAWTRAGRWTGAWSRPRPVMPTRPTWSASSATGTTPTGFEAKVDSIQDAAAAAS